MIGRLATAFILLVVPAGYVAAQDTPSSGGGFCATAPQDLLSALDGSWSLTQGRGIAIGGPPIPLPAHPPVEMGLEYNSEGGYAILSGQGQQMLMLPTSTETASNILGGLNENFVTATEGMDACDWYALPTLVGSNWYDLTRIITSQTSPSIGAADGTSAAAMIFFCINDLQYYTVFAVEEGGPVMVEVAQDIDWTSGPPSPNECNIPIDAVTGDMKMTIALKFDSPSSARGMLSFRGEQGGYHFAAWAPITMSR